MPVRPSGRPSPRCRISSRVRPSSSGCSWVCTNQPGRTRAPELGLAGVPDRLDLHVLDGPVLDVGVAAAPGQQPQEVRLAGAVGAEHGDPLAVPDLEVERLHQPGELEVLADHRALAGAAALEPHLHRLLARLLGRRAGLLELAEPGLGGLVLARHAVVVLRLDLEPEHQRLDLGVLLVPAAAHAPRSGGTGRCAPRGTTRSRPGGSTRCCRCRTPRARSSRRGWRCC